MPNLQVVATAIINGTTIETSTEITPSLATDFVVSFYTIRGFTEDDETLITLRIDDISDNVLINEYVSRVSTLRWQSASCFPTMRVSFIDGTNPIYAKVTTERNLIFTLDLIGYEV